MLNSIIADTLLVLHFFFIAFVVLGGLLVIKWHNLAVLHLPAVSWGALLEFYNWQCPLTPWEIHFRKAAGEQGFETGFIEHYLVPLIYPAGLNYQIQFLLGNIVILINAIIYLWIIISLYKQRQSGRN